MRKHLHYGDFFPFGKAVVEFQWKVKCQPNQEKEEEEDATVQ